MAGGRLGGDSLGELPPFNTFLIALSTVFVVSFLFTSFCTYLICVGMVLVTFLFVSVKIALAILPSLGVCVGEIYFNILQNY